MRGKSERVCYSLACGREVSRKRYRGLPAAYLGRNRRNTPRLRLAAARFVYEFLLEHPCASCGEADPVVLEFKHLDPDAKAAEIADLVHCPSSPARLMTENCECRCCVPIAVGERLGFARCVSRGSEAHAER